MEKIGSDGGFFLKKRKMEDRTRSYLALGGMSINSRESISNIAVRWLTHSQHGRRNCMHHTYLRFYGDIPDAKDTISWLVNNLWLSPICSWCTEKYSRLGDPFENSDFVLDESMWIFLSIEISFWESEMSSRKSQKQFFQSWIQFHLWISFTISGW